LKPIVIIPACAQKVGLHQQHGAQSKYVNAVLAAGCTPLILPALADQVDLEAVLASCHGVMLTGSPSNVHPSHYAQSLRDHTLPQDAARDATTLPLIRAVLARGMPLLGICRGFQEMNVALGGSLHQAVYAVDGMQDHRENKHCSLEQQYAVAHAVTITPGGLLAKILRREGDMAVNSLHGQGIDRLAPGLDVEARAEDGLVEAFSVSGAQGFALALQWHPEWRVAQNPAALRIFRTFGQACRDYRSRHMRRFAVFNGSRLT
jgi:putative glutamine amidotransferase